MTKFVSKPQILHIKVEKVSEIVIISPSLVQINPPHFSHFDFGTLSVWVYFMDFIYFWREEVRRLDCELMTHWKDAGLAGVVRDLWISRDPNAKCEL